MDEKPVRTSPAPSRSQVLRKAAQLAEARSRGDSTHRDRRRGDSYGATLGAWESEQKGRFGRWLGAQWLRVRGPTRVAALTTLAFVLGMQLAARPDGADLASLQRELSDSEVALQARQGELELVRMEMSRLVDIVQYSSQYNISADLAAAINDIALSEGIAPALAFRLVQVESGFYRRAVSPVGAVGLAQLMPRTAFELDPTLDYQDLFDRDTNLRLGFRYLRQMLTKYDGDLRLALLAYNRGPGTVDSIRRIGGDPANGYARAVMGGAR
ncbi:MAG TPA: lytic transglycosylase domain-containing protein [Longimicrobiales bacterium]|nr:lytic transglycosylase domain-containing protein [Longimicrobiales bacterium]